MMIWSILKLSNFRTLAFIALGSTLAYFYFKSQYHKKESIIQTENARQLQKWTLDSVKMAEQLFSERQMNDYLETSNNELGEKLKNDRIKWNRIERIISQTLQYRDTTKKETDLSKMVESIKRGVVTKQPFKDETPCLLIEGYVLFDGDSLSLNINNRKFKNKSEVVSYWERRQWNFLGIKTKVFGKKQVTVKIYDSCGKSETFIVNKK